MWGEKIKNLVVGWRGVMGDTPKLRLVRRLTAREKVPPELLPFVDALVSLFVARLERQRTQGTDTR
jgi:hypothetical protein